VRIEKLILRRHSVTAGNAHPCEAAREGSPNWVCKQMPDTPQKKPDICTSRAAPCPTPRTITRLRTRSHSAKPSRRIS